MSRRRRQGRPSGRSRRAGQFPLCMTTGPPSLAGGPPVGRRWRRGLDDRRGLATPAAVVADGTVARERGQRARWRTGASHRRDASGCRAPL